MRPVLVVFAAFALFAASAEARILPQAQQAYHLLAATAKAEMPVLHLVALDEGGGAPNINYNRDRVLGIFLAIIPGFGLGHFWLNDQGGFVTFLIVDTVLWGSFLFFPGALGFVRWPFGLVVFLAKVWQVYDVSRLHGGGSDEPGVPPPLPARPEVRPAWAETAAPALSLAF